MKNKTIYVIICTDTEAVKNCIEGESETNVWKFYKSSEKKVAEALDKISDGEVFQPEV